MLTMEMTHDLWAWHDLAQDLLLQVRHVGLIQMLGEVERVH
jgi:hypothetical protein